MTFHEHQPFVFEQIPLFSFLVYKFCRIIKKVINLFWIIHSFDAKIRLRYHFKN